MKKTLIAATALSLLGTVAIAQTAAPRSAPNQTASAPTTVPSNTTGPSSSRSGDVNAASGNSNQAVATTSANAPSPARGANSFTEREARSRLEAKGFSNVGGLAKDNDGVWRGTAQKDSRQAQVWLDYKGNVGQQ